MDGRSSRREKFFFRRRNGCAGKRKSGWLQELFRQACFLPTSATVWRPHLVAPTSRRKSPEGWRPGPRRSPGVDFMKRFRSKFTDRFAHILVLKYGFCGILVFFQIPACTLAGFDLTAHSSSLLGGRRRRYHMTTPPGHISSFKSKLITVIDG
jgi:hypothetical protein